MKIYIPHHHWGVFYLAVQKHLVQSMTQSLLRLFTIHELLNYILNLVWWCLPWDRKLRILIRTFLKQRWAILCVDTRDLNLDIGRGIIVCFRIVVWRQSDLYTSLSLTVKLNLNILIGALWAYTDFRMFLVFIRICQRSLITKRLLFLNSHRAPSFLSLRMRFIATRRLAAALVFKFMFLNNLRHQIPFLYVLHLRRSHLRLFLLGKANAVMLNV